MKRVMIFGTFDIVHDGHRHLLHEAASMGEEVIIVVSRDEHVLELKGKLPLNVLEERMETISCESEVTEVIPSDEELGTYGVIEVYKPDIVLLGYDQDELRASLLTWMDEQELTGISVTHASAYEPEMFNTNILAEQMEEEGLSLV